MPGRVTSGQIAGLDGGKIQKKSIPSDRIHALHGSKITGKESVPWDCIKVSGVVFTHRLESEIADLKHWANHRFQRKPQ